MKYLSKSRFKIALDCPRKLYYTNKEVYENTKANDDFLQALAEGGFQVGELAKCYYPNGHDIKERSSEKAIKITNELLKQDNVVIYEAAINYNNLLIRIDVLEKIGKHVKLIEVKAKSIDGSDESTFLDKNGFLAKKWRDYVYDVAFQKYVLEKAFPEFQIDAYLMLADKNKTATVNGLNQKFQLTILSNDRTGVKLLGDTSLAALGEPILTAIKVNDTIDMIFSGTDSPEPPAMGFEEMIQYYADAYENDKKLFTPIGKHCSGCEYHSKKIDKKSGFNECWKEQTPLTDNELASPLIFSLWKGLVGPKDIITPLMEDNIFLLKDINESYYTPASHKVLPHLSPTDRRDLQIKKHKNGDNTPFIDTDGLKAEMDSFTYPLHFIDFETSMVAIPFYKGSKPYEQIAFQFSHHIMYEDGKVEHKGQFIFKEKGILPNFEFLRALKKALENDNGTIFRYHNHENTVLNQIADQLNSSTEPIEDKNELLAFIDSITHRKNHEGERDMVDLYKMVVNYFYHPNMGGSNSIKAVLPAVINSSDFIQKKYSKPIYGKNSEIKSLNFEDGWNWIEFDEDGKVKDPYKLLPNLFEDIPMEEAENFLTEEHLAGGGAALTAFAKMQFTEMSETERQHVMDGLLRYCELDTLAMVMIYEYWLNEIKSKKK